MGLGDQKNFGCWCGPHHVCSRGIVIPFAGNFGRRPRVPNQKEQMGHVDCSFLIKLVKVLTVNTVVRGGIFSC